MKKRAFAATAAALLLFVPQTASADPILIDQWYTFGFGGTGSSLTSGVGYSIGTNPAAIAAPDASWTFSLAEGGSLLVVDGFNSGDRFQISNFGIDIGITSAPVLGQSCGDDITACLNNAALSQGTFNLAAGNHSISGTVANSPFGSGAGFFRVSAVTSVPEPTTWAMMLIGFAGIGVALRRRRRSVMICQSA
ncbi:MAG: PEPxxWA-CTERM sorting domain-containing protein [Sphingomicrobium sp.]